MSPFILTALLAAAPDGGAPCPGCQAFFSPVDAFEAALNPMPVMLGVGEYHELAGAPKVRSAIKRFTTELLPKLKGRVTSLIVETWMLNGQCGEVEKKAAGAIAKTTQRPKETEDEVETLLDRSYAMGVKNHILLVNCDEYRKLLDDTGSLDAEQSLLMVKRKLEEKAVDVREKEEGGVQGKLLVLYGGALHNDLTPTDDWKAYAFGPELARETSGGYVELDLLVPEYVDTDEELLKEPWFKPALKLARDGRTVLVSPKPNVRVLLFAYTRKKAR